MQPWLERACALSLLASCFTACGDDDSPEPDQPTRDAAVEAATGDASHADAEADAKADATSADATTTDATTADATLEDADVDDASSDDASIDDASIADATPNDASAGDASDAQVLIDAGPADAGPVDASADASADAGADAGVDAGPVGPATFARRVVTSGLANPWEVLWGPDAKLWVTERSGKRVIRVDPSSGARATLLTVEDAYQASGQDGVLGLALHPQLLQNQNNDWVYVASIYDADASASVERRAKITRYRYRDDALVEPTILLDGLRASSDHNTGRLLFGPDAQLYYAIGDQGKNQFGLKCLTILAQQLPTQVEVDARDWTKYQGKVLRIALDGSIPADNPVLAGVRSHVFTYGHRNPQGLTFASNGKLYSSEQGPKTDDELNLLSAGRNYGWPRVAGARDGKAYVYGNWSASSTPCDQLTYSDYTIPASVPTQSELDFDDAAFTPPLATFYTVESDHNFMEAKCAASPYLCWPTIAPSSVLFHPQSGVPGWGDSLLLTSLKDGAVYRLAITGDTVGAPEKLFDSTNRYRDLALSADGRAIYVATDAQGDTRASDGSPTSALEDRGAIIEYRYTP